ncbi:hypothetical protein [Gimesia sp.]|uniref:hypothetical protein n=1 Tax=Gimesia sp. TaxID=2024833 RepID=UPI003A8FEA0D
MNTTLHQVQHADWKTKIAAPILVIADDEKDIHTEKEGIETVKGLSLQGFEVNWQDARWK